MVEKVQIKDATLYCGDCLEALELVDPVDAILTDPPFSSGARTDAAKSTRGGMLRGAKWDADWFTHDNLATHGFLYLMRLLGVSLLERIPIWCSARGVGRVVRMGDPDLEVTPGDPTRPTYARAC